MYVAPKASDIHKHLGFLQCPSVQNFSTTKRQNSALLGKGETAGPVGLGIPLEFLGFVFWVNQKDFTLSKYLDFRGFPSLLSEFSIHGLSVIVSVNIRDLCFFFF